MMNKEKFSNWLYEQMQDKNISQAELARRARRTRATINNYVNKKINKPDNDVLIDIADGLDVPDFVVFRKAGILKSVDLAEEIIQEFFYTFEGLSPIDKEDVLEYTRHRKMLAGRREQ
jgi:transcriptional regulator with XRE-family HTH domain